MAGDKPDHDHGHGHGHDDHHKPPYVVPDYTTFSADGIPQLEELKSALALKGLRDPWIRNDAWRYHKGFGTRWQNARLLFRGFWIGAVLTALHVTYNKMTADEHSDGHGHH